MIPRQLLSDDSNSSLRSNPDTRARSLVAEQRLHRLSGVARAIYRHIDRQAAMHSSPLRVLVVPCPDIEIPLNWARRSLNAGTEIDYVLANVDSSESITDRIAAVADQGATIECLDLDYRRAPVPTGFDLVVSMYGMHPLREDEAFRRLQSLIFASDGPLVVCDFARSRTNYWLAKFACQMISRDPTARRSTTDRILAAYSVAEFQRIAEDALARPVNVESLFPCHLMMSCEEQAVAEAVPAFA